MDGTNGAGDPEDDQRDALLAAGQPLISTSDPAYQDAKRQVDEARRRIDELIEFAKNNPDIYAVRTEWWSPGGQESCLRGWTA